MTFQFDDKEIKLFEKLIAMGYLWELTAPKDGPKPESLMDEVAKYLRMEPEDVVDMFYRFEDDFNFLTHFWVRKASGGLRGHARSKRERPDPEEWNLQRICLLQSGVIAYERFMQENKRMPAQWRPLPKKVTPTKRPQSNAPRVWEFQPERPAAPPPEEPVARWSDRLDNAPRMSTGKTVRPNAPASGPRPMRPRSAPPLEIRTPGRPKKAVAAPPGTEVVAPKRKPGRPPKNPSVVRPAATPVPAEMLPQLLVPADAPFRWFVLAMVEARPIIYSEDAAELLLELIAMRRELPSDRREARTELLEVLEALEADRQVQIYRHFSGGLLRQVRIRLEGQEALAGYEGLIAQEAETVPVTDPQELAHPASALPLGRPAKTASPSPVASPALSTKVPYPMRVLTIIQQLDGIRTDLDATVSLYQHVELSGRHMARSQAIELQMLRKIVTNLFVNHYLALEYQGFTVVGIQITESGKTALAAYQASHPVAEAALAE